MAKERGKLLVISGPSAGVGKDTLKDMFAARHPEWVQPPSTTTRPPRAGEVDGVAYNFVDKETFRQWQEEGKFLESFAVTGNLYGTLRAPVEKFLEEGKSVLLRKEVQGALAIKRKIGAAILVFIDVEDPDLIESRMRKRGTDSEEVIQSRVELADEERQSKNQFDYVVINPEGHPERAVAEIEQILGLKEAA